MWLVVGSDIRPSGFDLRGWDKNNLLFLTADLLTSLHIRDDCLITTDIIKQARNHTFEVSPSGPKPSVICLNQIWIA